MLNNIKFWDLLSARYDNQVEKVFSDAYKKMIEYTKMYVKDEDTVLDIGCGTGITTVEIANHVKEIHAVDLSDKMLDIAKKKALARNIDNIVFHQKSIFNQDFKGQEYDVVIAFNILCYIKEDTNFIDKIYVLLKEGGIFISVTDCLGEKETIIIKLQKLFGELNLIPKINTYSMAKLEAMICDKFELIQCENLHTSPPNYFVVGKKQ